MVRDGLLSELSLPDSKQRATAGNDRRHRNTATVGSLERVELPTEGSCMAGL